MIENLTGRILATLTIFLTIGTSLKAQSTQKELAKGDAMPSFSLINQRGTTFKSADFVGKSVLIIYFYPKDESMVCTKEACSFRDNFNDLTKAGATVIGINVGTVESHKKFAEHYKLPFILLSDPGNKVYNKFGVKNELFMTGRETFIINLQGKIVYSYAAMMQGKKHAGDALAYIKSHQTK